jgi:NAD(P)-dependent dehydrogenase (short-subunit alcohol dehydrogenase family)
VSDVRPIALITGAGGDVGRATACRLGQEGWSLALVDHPSRRGARDENAQLCATLGTPSWTDNLDATDADGVGRSVRARRRARRADGLINNAGYQGRFERIDRYRYGDARRASWKSTHGLAPSQWRAAKQLR